MITIIAAVLGIGGPLLFVIFLLEASVPARREPVGRDD
jgi:hypothetical protein